MKKIFLPVVFVVLSVFVSCKIYAQAGAVYTVAGGGSSTVDGVPATSASLSYTTGVGTDAAGNVYYAEKWRSTVKKIDAGTGLVYTVAGVMGLLGYSGDGGPATAAAFSGEVRGIWVTPVGDIYISDNDKIRKVNGASGIVTTVVGGGSSIFDGIPATNASLGSVYCVYVDVSGNIYTGSSDGRVRKVDAVTGMISTVAGGGTGGDGGQATAASLSGSAKSLCMDNAGNLYIIDFAGTKIRMVNAVTGIITTVAGGGSGAADGIPATNANFSDLYNCGVDGAGNIFIADWSRHLVRRVDRATGVINTIAGIPTGGSSAEGTPALSASVNPYMIHVKPATGNIYYSDFDAKVKRFSYGPLVSLSGSLGAYSSDSFDVNILKQCNGPQLTVRTHSYHPGMTIRTFFGDGTSDTLTVSSSWSGIGGFVVTGCTYPSSGTYSIRHVLCNYGVPVDSISYSYSHIFCSQMSIVFYNDADVNCIKDGADNYLIKSTVTEIDSNGVPVDTLVATSGFYYNAFGNAGDIYTFKLLSVPFGFYTSCPATGILYDTLFAGISENSPRYVGMSPVTPTMSDLKVSAYVPVTGPNDQWGHIYLQNAGCLPTDASVTINFSPKYRYTTGARPTPVSSTATSITWDLASISCTDGRSRDIYYVVWHNPAVPFPTDGDTVNEHISVTTTGGPIDVNMTNNTVIRTDTVSTSCDPNAIEVSPTCFDNDTTFHFTVHFENIGSAPAENIYVMDTLSPWLDPSTINIEMSTHTMFTSKHISNGRTIYKFDFPAINLADSSDHENRDGALMYTIKNKPGMAIGDAALSRVGIYFDYNDVLMTNTVENRKGCPVPTRVATTSTNRDISLFPNPTTEDLTIKTEGNTFTSFTITNAIGQQVWQQGIQKTEERVNLAHLPAGVYYVTLKGEGVSEVRKFVKW